MIKPLPNQRKNFILFLVFCKGVRECGDQSPDENAFIRKTTGTYWIRYVRTLYVYKIRSGK